MERPPKTGKDLLDAVSSWVGQQLTYVSGSSRPTDGAVQTYLARTGDPVALDAGPQPGLMARLDTPKGPITLR